MSAQNGRIERLIRTIMTFMRSLLAFARLSNRCWAYAAMHSVDLHYWTDGVHDTVLPYMQFYGWPEPVTNMKPFGCPAWVLLPQDLLNKLVGT